MTTELLKSDDLSNLEFETYIDEDDHAIYISKEKYKLVGNINPKEDGYFHIGLSQTLDSENRWVAGVSYIFDKSFWDEKELEHVMKVTGVDYKTINADDLFTGAFSQSLYIIDLQTWFYYTSVYFNIDDTKESIIEKIKDGIIRECS